MSSPSPSLSTAPPPPLPESSAAGVAPEQPPAFNYVLGFLLVGVAWGLTTPFIRRAARNHHPPPHPLLERADVRASPVKSRVYGAFFAVLDLLRNPRYAVPLVINLTGSVWFFLLIGQAGTCGSSFPPPLVLGHRSGVARRWERIGLGWMWCGAVR